MTRKKHFKKLNEELNQEIIRRYTAPNPDGTWVSGGVLAEDYGVTPPAIYKVLRNHGIARRTTGEAHTKYSRDAPKPLCKCGCGETVTHWVGSKGRWGRYVPGHYRTDAPYKHRDWLVEHYVTKRMTVDEMAAIFGISGTTIIHAMDKHGIPRRSVSEARIGRHLGPRNAAWKGGVTPERQRLYKTQDWKRTISACFKRDGYRCVRCGSPKLRKRGLHAHHVMPWAEFPEGRDDIDNLVTLCDSCHNWVHSKANFFGEFIHRVAA